MAATAPRVHLDSLGCKLNQAETEWLGERFLSAGYSLAASPTEADIYVLNTCTVTHVADRKARQLLRRARRSSPGILTVALGCYAERSPASVARLTGADLVLGNRRKDQVVEAVQTLRADLGLEGPLLSNGRMASVGRNRSFVKIQEGCQYACAFCIVPRVRGRARSVPPDLILDQVRQRVEEGFQEVVLTGTEVGDYGIDTGDSLVSLVARILDETPLSRLRISSLQPQELSERLLGLWQNPRLCRHLHLALQSGSPSVLARMRRPFTRDEYARAVELVRRAIPAVAITTDIIAGFPGETEGEFAESLAFCEEMRFANMHIFPYSQRVGTTAARMPGQVPEPVKQERVRRLIELAERGARAFARSLVGMTLPVLWEEQREVQGMGRAWTGLTDNYVRAWARCESDLWNRIMPTHLVEMTPEGLWGVPQVDN